MKKVYSVFTIIAISCATISANAQSLEKKKVSLNNIFKEGTFSSKSVYGINNMKDGRYYSTMQENPITKDKYILKYSFITGQVIDTLIKTSELKFEGKSIGFDSYQFSEDENQVLLSTDVEPVYRRSALENNYVVNLKTKKVNFISGKSKQKYTCFSPDGKSLAYVRDNNLYVYNVSSNTETQITNDGKKNEIINGGTDWVYEEEFEFARAFFWSKDSKKIAFYKFNESEVPEFSMTMYGELYPNEYKYKYPKAGEKNSVVQILVWNSENSSIKQLDLGENKDQYIPRIKWTQDANVLCVYRMNRLQNNLELLNFEVNTGQYKSIYTEKNKSYVEVNDDLLFLPNGKSFILSSEKDGYKHIYHYALSGELIQQITSGKFEVTNIYGFDKQKNQIYYQSTEQSSTQRGIYRIDLDGKVKLLISKDLGTNDAKFSNDFSLYINFYSNANQPLSVNLFNNKGNLIRSLENNTKLLQTLAEYDLGKKEFLSVPNSKGELLNAWILKPSNFDPNKKYPLFMFVYGGPGSQQVLDSWGGSNLMWYQMLAQQGFIVACVDNRGTGGRGKEFKDCTYMDLGNLETQDQIDAAKWFATQQYIDGNRIGIQGWSYGGYMSSLCIAKGSDIFKAAIAVAPVTNWKYYDSIYTERYLRTPKENEKGYEENSPINFVKGIKGKYLLIHGTADDNVHFQNSVDLVSALVKENIPFESAYYPNKNHGIYGGNTRLHLYTKMTNFILTNW